MSITHLSCHSCFFDNKLKTRTQQLCMSGHFRFFLYLKVIIKSLMVLYLQRNTALSLSLLILVKGSGCLGV